MRLWTALALALVLPACASMAAQEGSKPGAKSGEDWYAGDPTGKKEYGRKGAYGGIALLQGIEQFDAGTSGIAYDDSDLGFAIRGGWRTKEGLAVEGSIESVTGYGFDVGPFDEDVDLSSFSVTGKYYLASDRVQPYAMVGLGWAWLESDATDADADGAFVRLGGGVDVYVSKDVAIFAEASYNRMTGDVKDFDHVDVLLGVLFRF